MRATERDRWRFPLESLQGVRPSRRRLENKKFPSISRLRAFNESASFKEALFLPLRVQYLD